MLSRRRVRRRGKRRRCARRIIVAIARPAVVDVQPFLRSVGTVTKPSRATDEWRRRRATSYSGSMSTPRTTTRAMKMVTPMKPITHRFRRSRSVMMMGPFALALAARGKPPGFDCSRLLFSSSITLPTKPSDSGAVGEGAMGQPFFRVQLYRKYDRQNLGKFAGSVQR